MLMGGQEGGDGACHLKNLSEIQFLNGEFTDITLFARNRCVGTAVLI